MGKRISLVIIALLFALNAWAFQPLGVVAGSGGVSPISLTDLTSGFDGTDRGNGDPYTTASVTCGANQLCLVALYATGLSSQATEPSLSGWGGTTFVRLGSGLIPATNAGFWVFRTMVASDQTGAVSIDPPENWTNAHWSVVEFDNVDTSGTFGSGAIVQVAENNTADGGDPGTDQTVTLSAFASANNRPYLASGSRISGSSGSEEHDPESGWAQINEVVNGFIRVFDEWDEDSNDNTCYHSWTTSDSEVGALCAELKNGS